MKQELELSVVIPVYNEGANIINALEAIVQEVRKAVSTYEIVVVDDGSTDETWGYLEQCQLHLDNLEGIRLSRHFGKELAICAGLEHAQGQAVIVMDAGWHHPPSCIPFMIELWRTKKGEIIEGVRRVPSNEPLMNRMASRLFYGLLNKGTGYDFWGTSEFKLLDRQVVEAWKRLSERNIFFAGMSNWLGFRKVHFNFDAPLGGYQQGFSDLLSLTKQALKLLISFSSFPLRLISYAGLIFLLISFILGGYALYQKVIGNVVTGLTTIILLLLMLGSLILLSLGIMAEYLASMYNELKGRPRYIIDDRLVARRKERIVDQQRARTFEAMKAKEWSWLRK